MGHYESWINYYNFELNHIYNIITQTKLDDIPTFEKFCKFAYDNSN